MNVTNLRTRRSLVTVYVTYLLFLVIRLSNIRLHIIHSDTIWGLEFRILISRHPLHFDIQSNRSGSYT